MLKLAFVILLPLLLLIGMAATLPRNNVGFLSSHLEPITAANAHRVQEVAVLGRGTPRDVAWSSDGRTLAVATTIGIWLYDFNPNAPSSIQDAEPRLLRAHRTEVHTVAFSPDSPLLASAGEGTDYGMVYLWDITSGEPLHVLHENEGAVTGIAFGRDGALLITGLDAQLWDTRAVLCGGEPVLVARNHTNTWVFTAALSQDGKIAVLRDNNGTLHLWDIAQNTVHPLLGGAVPTAWRVALSPDAAVLAYDTQGIMVLLDMASGERIAAVDLRSNNHWPHVWDIEFSPDGRWLTATAQDNIPLTIWDIENAPREFQTSLPVVASLCCSEWSAGRVAFHPGGELFVVTDHTSGVRLWNIATSTQLAELRFDRQFTGAAFDEQAGVVTARVDFDKRAHWDLTTGERIVTDAAWSLLPSRAPFLDSEISQGLARDSRASEAFTLDRTLRVTYDEYTGELRLWDNRQNTIMIANYSPLSFISDIAVSSQYIALGEFFGEVSIWDTKADPYEPLYILELSESSAQVAINADGTVLATGGHGVGNLVLRDIKTGQPLAQLPNHTERTEHTIFTVQDIAFHPDGRLMLTAGSDGTVRLWGIPA